MSRRTNTAYGYGRIRRRPNGSFLADLKDGHGGRTRRTFKTRIEAQFWLDRQAVEPVEMTVSQLGEAAEAFSLLPDGVTLLEVVRAGLRTLRATPSSDTPFHVLAEMFVAERGRELRETTTANYRRCLSRALEALGDNVAAYTTAALREYVAQMTPHNRNRNLRALSAFFSWAVESGHLKTSPVSGIRLAKVAEPSRAVLTPEQMAHLLKAAEAVDARTVPYFALCAFAGLRPTEAVRLTSSEIGAEYITLGAAQTKTASARTVAIRPNLRAILDRHPVRESVTQGLSPDRFRKVLVAVVKASGIQWTQDVLRHSYASYAYELSRDAAATAAEMGHTGTSIFFRHYRGLVPPGSGERWFAIGTKSAQGDKSL